MLTTYQHGKLSLESSGFLAHVKKHDDCPLPSQCISAEKDWKWSFGCGMDPEPDAKLRQYIDTA
jgi:hypothetical protein